MIKFIEYMLHSKLIIHIALFIITTFALTNYKDPLNMVGFVICLVLK